jgi:hypothetical protein
MINEHLHKLINNIQNNIATMEINNQKFKLEFKSPYHTHLNQSNGWKAHTSLNMCETSELNQPMLVDK